MEVTIEGIRCLDTAGVMSALGCGRAKVFTLRASGAINAVRVGNQTYSSVLSVEEYLRDEAERIRAGLSGT